MTNLPIKPETKAGDPNHKTVTFTVTCTVDRAGQLKKAVSKAGGSIVQPL